MFSITPSTRAILGGTSDAPTAPPLQEQREPRTHLSFWGRLKQKARCVLGVVERALTFTKEILVPIITAVSSLVGAVRQQKPHRGTGKCYICYA